MTREETIEYLSACIDAERGVYGTERLSEEIDKKIWELKCTNYKNTIQKPEIEPAEFKEPMPELHLLPDLVSRNKLDIIEAEIKQKKSNMGKLMEYESKNRFAKARVHSILIVMLILDSAEIFYFFLKKCVVICVML